MTIFSIEQLFECIPINKNDLDLCLSTEWIVEGILCFWRDIFNARVHLLFQFIGNIFLHTLYHDIIIDIILWNV